MRFHVLSPNVLSHYELDKNIPEEDFTFSVEGVSSGCFGSFFSE
jgi:hypothetical protein